MSQQLSRDGLGGSEIPMVAGLSPFGTAWDVFAAKVHGLARPQTEPMKWGLLLEPAIRGNYCDETGHVVIVPRRSLFHPDRPWQRATPDGMIYLDADAAEIDVLARMAADMLASRTPPSHLLQAKNVSEWMGRAHWEGVPDYVQAQVQWEMSVTGAAAADVAALVGGNKYHCERVHRDESFIEDLLAIGSLFMQQTSAGLPPPIDHSDACRAHLQRHINRAANVEVLADAEAEAAIRAWKAAHLAERKATRELETARNHVRAAFARAEATTLLWSEGSLRLRAAYETSRTDYKLVAQLVASTSGMAAAELEKLVASATTKTQIEATPAASKNWSKAA
ncbi:MAG: YqaJ viral recombinase family protein, partial [Alsobacter sp.]